MMCFTYTIFDADPHQVSGSAWTSHMDRDIEADSDADALDEVRDTMSIEAAGLSPADGYQVGQTLYALVWDADGVLVGEPRYEITEEDLG